MNPIPLTLNSRPILIVPLPDDVDNVKVIDNVVCDNWQDEEIIPIETRMEK